jgi:hypothetical protein
VVNRCRMGSWNVSPSHHLKASEGQSMPTPSSRTLPHDFFDDALPFKMDGVYCKLIPLTNNQFAIVWLSDYEALSRYAWGAIWNACTKSFYAWRGEKIAKTRRNRYFGMHREILGLQRGDRRQADHRELYVPAALKLHGEFARLA